MSRQIGSPRGAKAKADRFFSLIVRSRGFCECCLVSTNLQTAHIISRRYSHTRCVEENALCLCAGCHHRFTDHPVAFGQWVTRRMGEDAYRELTRMSQQTGKMDWFAVTAELKARWEAIEAAA